LVVAVLRHGSDEEEIDRILSIREGLILAISYTFCCGAREDYGMLMRDRFFRRPLWTVAIITLGAIAVSVFMVAASAPYMPGGTDWKRFALGILIATVTAPLFAYPVVGANYRLRRMRAELEHLARTDPLCELPNRRGFFEDARTLFAERDALAPIAVMMIDIDHFKLVNDEYGHEVGDAILQNVGRTIGRVVMNAQGATKRVAGRIGGEEFAVVLAGIDAKAALRVADDICDAIRGLFYVQSGASIRTTVSIGVVMRLGFENVDAVLRAADVAMYEAKRCGRDRCHFGGARDGLAVAMRIPTDSKRPAPEPLQAA
jgi:diguanylate cyclase (GGDEF)-like protein